MKKFKLHDFFKSEIYFKDMYNDSSIDFYSQSEPSIPRLNIHKLKNPRDYYISYIYLFPPVHSVLHDSRIGVHVNSIKNRRLIDTGI